jgi:hypothetical protein
LLVAEEGFDKKSFLQVASTPVAQLDHFCKMQMQKASASSYGCSQPPALILPLFSPAVNKLVAFRDSMRVRSTNWAAAIATWTCPTPPANTSPAGVCDPCGNSYNGNWYHMHCRGNTRGERSLFDSRQCSTAQQQAQQRL